MLIYSHVAGSKNKKKKECQERMLYKRLKKKEREELFQALTHW